jgi:hypothetical protein
MALYMRAKAKTLLGDTKGAKLDYSMAIKLYPSIEKFYKLTNSN